MEESAINWHSLHSNEFDNKYNENKSFIERYAILTALIDKYSNQEKSVLDMGCGSGVFSYYASTKNKSVLGIDGSEKMIELCNNKNNKINKDNIKFILGDVTKSNSLLYNSYDIIISSSLLEYINDLERVIDNMYSLLSCGGIVILTMPNRNSLYRKCEKLCFSIFAKPSYYKFVKNISSVPLMEHTMVKSGFKILETDYYAATPFVSKVFRQIGLQKYSENLFVLVALKEKQEK